MAFSAVHSGIGAAMAVAGVLLTLGPAAAAPAPPVHAPATTSAPAHDYLSDAPLTQVFAAFCMKAFPDAAAVDAALKVRSEAPLTPEQAKLYLPDGSGKGWLVRTSDSLFALTVEDTPNQTCAVQQMTPDGVRDVANLVDAIKTRVKAMKGKMVEVAPAKATPADGPEIRYWGYGVLNADDTPTEQFGVYISDYKGKPPEPWTPYAGKGSGVAVRFTRTLLAG